MVLVQEKALCSDNIGSFTCACQPGYSGDGVLSCSNTDECTTLSCNSTLIVVRCTNGTSFVQLANDTAPDDCIVASPGCTPIHTCKVCVEEKRKRHLN